MQLIALLTALLLGTPDKATFERILLPLHSGATAGAHGSSWGVDEVIANVSSEPVKVYPYYYDMFPLQGVPEVRALMPGARHPSRFLDYPAPCRICPPPPHPGAILWIEKGAGHRVTAYDRIFERNHDGDNHGAVVPGVREGDFRRGRTAFLDIPVAENFRTTVRIYNVAETDLMITMNVYDATDSVAFTQTFAVPPSRGAYPDNGLPLIPGYAQMSLESALQVAVTGPVRIELVPITAEPLYWSFATVTSNSAQRVTVFTP